ncbi:MAG: 4-hydroxy-tetrahydrodipicolinate synthase [Candidatus Acetothermia bacterium]
MFEFRGVAPPIITPFGEEGSIDESALRDIIEWFIENDVHGIVPCGSTGEVANLTPAERVRVIEITVDQVRGRVPVIAGTGSPSTARTVEMTRTAGDLGADASLVVTPFYYPLDQKEIEDHYHKVLKETDLPIFLYNVPKFTHQSIAPETVRSLSHHPNAVGIKESSGDMGSFQQMVKETRDRSFHVYCGSGDLFASSLMAGGSGGILALANIAPRQCSKIYELYSQNREEGAIDLNYQLLSLNRAIGPKFGVAGLKAGLRYRGLPAGIPRPPLSPLSGAEEEEMIEIVEQTLNT